MSDITESPVFKLGFRLAGRLSEPDFRRRLRQAGASNGTPLLGAVGDEPLRDVVARMTHYDKGLIVIEDETEPEGVRLIWWEKR